MNKFSIILVLCSAMSMGLFAQENVPVSNSYTGSSNSETSNNPKDKYSFDVSSYFDGLTEFEDHQIFALCADALTDEEKDIVRRGRNTENHHVAKNADIADYAQSTAFEALIGYLYLTKQDKRLEEILNMCID